MATTQTPKATAAATPKAEDAPKAPTPTPEPTNARGLHGSIAEALAAFQSALPTIGKENTANVRSKDGGQQYSYTYADLASISEVALPLLAEEGLAWTCQPTVTKTGAFVLKYALLHDSGESIRGQYPLGNPNARPQDVGSAITYAKRYALCAVTGIAPTDDDDDAAAAQNPGRVPTTPPRPVAAAEPEYLPEGIYDLGAAMADLEVMRDVYRTAGRAGHLHLRVTDADGNVMALGQWLTNVGQRLAEETPF